MAIRLTHDRRWWLFPLMLCIVGLANSSSTAGAADVAGSAIAGTYEILICRGVCASSNDANVLVKGHVVLFAGGLDDATVKRLDPSYYPSTPHERPNGCYELVRAQKVDRAGYAGISPFGITGWYYREDAVAFGLYHSPDAGYEAIVKPTSGGLSGHGTSWGAGAAAPTEPDIQTVLARRVGDSDVRSCEQWSVRDR